MVFLLEEEVENLEIDNPDILTFLNFLPLSTFDDYPETYKYYNNAIFHYKNVEYELSIFSFYLLYMHILHCFILKKKLFQLPEIQKDFQNHSGKYPIPTVVNPLHYSILPDRNKIKILDRKDLSEDYLDIQTMRNDIHNIGLTKSDVEMNIFLDKVVKILENLYVPILTNLFYKMNFETELKQEDCTIVQDFLLSQREMDFIYTLLK